MSSCEGAWRARARNLSLALEAALRRAQRAEERVAELELEVARLLKRETPPGGGV